MKETIQDPLAYLLGIIYDFAPFLGPENAEMVLKQAEKVAGLEDAHANDTGADTTGEQDAQVREADNDDSGI